MRDFEIEICENCIYNKVFRISLPIKPKEYDSICKKGYKNKNGQYWLQEVLKCDDYIEEDNNAEQKI